MKKNYPQVVVVIISDKKSRILVSQESLNNQVTPRKWQNPSGNFETGENHIKILKKEAIPGLAEFTKKFDKI